MSKTYRYNPLENTFDIALDDTLAVPYTGATASVNLGAFNITATSLVTSGGTSNQMVAGDGTLVVPPTFTFFV